MEDLVRVSEHIFTIRDFMSPAECDEWIRFSEEQGFTAAKVNSRLGQEVVERVRNNSRVIFDSHDTAEALWQRLGNQVPEVIPGWAAIGLNERFRFYRYDVGERFHWHADGVVRRDNGEQSLVTFMVYLNDNFSGGGTAFRELNVEPERGSALLFSHWLKHMGAEVTDGRKYVLRTDVMFAKVQT